MDVREAVNALDAYSDRPVRLALLLEADHFRMKDADIEATRESLLLELRQTSKSCYQLRNQDCRCKGSSAARQ
jgi:hypothetical protein